MARLISYEGKGLPSIEGFVIYPLNEALIIRAKSGFTAEGLQNNPKYDLCKKNVSEFGAVSRVCKLIRMALHEVLPKQNMLDMVNAFTKKMHSLLVYDKLHEKGARTITSALSTKEGSKALMGYDFNPDSAFAFNYAIDDKQLIVQIKNTTACNLPWISLRLMVLDVNLETGEGNLHINDWNFEKHNTLALCYDIPEVKETIGSLFYLLEVQAFTLGEAAYVPAKDAKGLLLFDLVIE
jgi:hypothetical protein